MKIKQNDLVLLNVIGDGEYGLLNPLTRKLHRINRTAKFIWDLCAEPQEPGIVVRRVAEHSGLPVDEVGKDAEEFLQDMLRYELFCEV
jgi:hypothetical protein